MGMSYLLRYGPHHVTIFCTLGKCQISTLIASNQVDLMGSSHFKCRLMAIVMYVLYVF